MKKKLRTAVISLLVLSLILSLCACGKKKQEEEASETVTPVTIGEAVYTPDEADYIYTLNYDSELYNGEKDFVVLRYVDGGLYASLSDTEGTKLCFASETGGDVVEFEAYQPLYSRMDSASGGYLVFLDMYEGGFVAIENVFGYTEQKNGSFSYNSWNYLRVLDQDGKEVNTVLLDGITNVNMNGGAALCSDGSVLVCDGEKCTAFDLEGKKLYEVTAKKSSISGLVKTRDGRTACITSGKSGNSLFIVEDYLEGQTNEISLPQGTYSEDFVTGSGYYDLCYTLGSTFYGLNINDRRTDALFNWINAGIVSDEVQSVRAKSDGTISAIKYDYSYYYDSASVNTVSVCKVPAETDTRKPVKVAAIYAEYNLWYSLIDFNLTNKLFRAELVDYSVYNTADDSSIAYTRLLEDIKSGEAPDVIYTGQLDDSQFKKFGKAGYLEDLYPRIDDDIALSRRDYNLTAFSAGEYEGRLLAVVPSYTVSAYAGITEHTGTPATWNKDKAKSALSALNSGAAMVYEGKGSGADYKEDYVSLKDGDCLLIPAEIGSLYDVASLMYLTEADLTFLPLADGTGKTITGNRTFSINANGADKELAWSFVSYFFTEEYQLSFCKSFPSNVHALKKLAAADAADAVQMYFDAEDYLTEKALLSKLEQLTA